MNKQKSFTLIELLVVIVIIGILAGVIMISTSSSMDKANLAKAQAFSSNVQESLLSNLISEWTFDEDVSPYTMTKDTWGTNNGPVTGATYKDKDSGECILGGCYNFDGNDYIDCGTAINFHGKSKISASVWINATLLPVAYSSVLNRHGDWNNAQGTIMFNNEKKLRVLIKTTTASGDLISNTVFSENKWYYIVYSWDGQIVKLYLNGKEDNDLPLTGTVNTTTSVPNTIIGAYQAKSSSFFNGRIDDVRIYNTFLSSSQIKQNYIAGLYSLLSKGSISKEEYYERMFNLSIK